MNSAAYQLSSDANATNQARQHYYSKYIVKRLPAEVLLDAMSQVTGVPTRVPRLSGGHARHAVAGLRVHLAVPDVFGRPARIICDAAERSSDPSIAQALHVINGDTLNKKLSDPNGYVNLFQRLGLSETRILDQLYGRRSAGIRRRRSGKHLRDLIRRERLQARPKRRRKQGGRRSKTWCGRC